MNIYKKYRQIKHISTTALLEQSPQIPIIFWGIATVASMVVLLIIWAAFAKLPEISRTFGEIVPKGRVQVVEHLEGGTVTAVFVNNGDKVSKGQLLVKIDPIADHAELLKSRAQMMTLLLDKARLQTYLNREPAETLVWPKDIAKDVIPPKDMQDLLSKERAFLSAQNEKRRSEKIILNAQISQSQEQLNKLQNELETWRRNIVLLKEEFNMYLALKKEGYISHKDYLVVLRDLNQSEGELLRIESDISRTKKVIIEAQYRMKELDATLDTDALKELGVANDNILQVKHQIEKLENRLSHMAVHAPIAGVIKGLRVFAGNVIQPGELVTEIVPSDQPLLAEVQITPRDIGHIKIGDPVILKVMTYDFAHYGSIHGKLIEISAANFVDSNNKSYYKAVAELDRPYMLYHGEKKYLLPGMTVEGDIVTGKKTFLLYLLSPIRTSTNAAFKER